MQSEGGGRSIATLEDPVEGVIEGTTQSQVRPSAGFDLATGLRSLVRQDPEVILVGEIRDSETAQIALQAAMTGQLVLSTFHAADAVEAVERLIDLGLPSYALRYALRLVLAQRLVRRLCALCREPQPGTDGECQELAAAGYRAVGCDHCGGTGYHGRHVIGEVLRVESGPSRQCLASPEEAAKLRQYVAPESSLWGQAKCLVNDGTTSEQEVLRLLGLPPSDGVAGS